MGPLGLIRRWALAVLGPVFALQAAGQGIPDTIRHDVEEAVESALENSTRDVEDSQYADALMQLSTTLIDLNSASESEFRQIPGIDAMLASRMVTYRSERGFNSVDDLVYVEGMDRSRFLQVRGFFTVKTKSVNQDVPSIHYTGRTIRRLQNQSGFLDGSYSGSQYKIYNRIRTRYPVSSNFSVEAGGLTEKDPGEKNIADFFSGYLSLSNSTRSMRCIVGDFVVEAGQGLAFWRSSGTTKGTEVISSVIKNSRGLQPYASSDENGFLRGAGIQIRLGTLDVTAFLSSKSINANVTQDGSISSLDASGLFRTELEQKAKSSSTERIMGMSLETKLFDGFKMGVRGYSTRFNRRVLLSSINGFQGQQASMSSIDFAYTTANIGSFGEAAMDQARSIAAIGGIILRPAPTLDIALIIHSYPQQFVSLHGFGFGESGGGIQNEGGAYTSARLSLFAWLNISAYYDQFATRGASTTSPLPTNGNEFLAVLQLTSGETSSLQFQVKQRNLADDELSVDTFSRSNSVVGRRVQSNYRGSFEWSPSPIIRWKVRLERVDVHYSIFGSPATGLLFYQDVRLKPRTHLSIDGRVAVFDTDSYDSRIYEYESELHGTFVNPALYGKGIRMYVLTRYDLGSFEVSLKYSTTLKPGTRSQGSGTNEIQGDMDNQLSFQIDVDI